MKSQRQVADLMHQQVEELPTKEVRDAVAETRIEPIQEKRTFHTPEGDAQGSLWLFACLPDKEIGFAYSEDGYDALGIPWGLIFISGSDYGDSGLVLIIARASRRLGVFL